MSNPATGKIYALFDTPVNKKIIARLNETGTDYFLFPPLETEKVFLDDEKKMSAINISEFDWLIFSDVLAVDYFLDFLSVNEVDFFELDAVRICAFGEAVADRLRFGQIHADVIPTDFETGSIFTNIKSYVGDGNLTDLRFLLIKEHPSDFEIADVLREQHAEVFALPIYQTLIADKTENVRLKTLIKGGAVDEFIFSAPEDLIALKHYFPGDNLKNIFSEIQISTPDTNIFQNLKEYNLSPRYFVLK